MFAVILVIGVLLDDGEGGEYTESDYTNSEYAANTENEGNNNEDISSGNSGFAGNTQVMGGVEYVVTDPVGVYRSFDSSAADSDSEEISELVDGRIAEVWDQYRKRAHEKMRNHLFMCPFKFNCSYNYCENVFCVLM